MSDLRRKLEEYKKWLKIAGAGLGVAGLVYFGYRCYTHDSVEYLSDPSKLRSSYDFIVVGAGTSGSVVARRLCEHASNPSVLLIESGGPDDFTLLSPHRVPAACQLNQRTKFDHEFFTIPQNKSCRGLVNNQSFWPRGKVMGGSSVLNYGIWVRGSRHDYDSWAQEHGCLGWSYDDILPFFKRIECVNVQDEIFSNLKKKDANFKDLKKFRGLDGPLGISHRVPIAKMSKLYFEAARSCGHEENSDYNGNDGNNAGVSHTQYSMKLGSRHSSFRAYVAPIFEDAQLQPKRPNIDILPYSHVSKIVWKRNKSSTSGTSGLNGIASESNDNNLVATGVEFYYKDDRSRKYLVNLDWNDGGEVILCGGSVSSPQLLMLSGVGAKEELAGVGVECVLDARGVGSNLQDHILTGLRMTVPRDIELLSVSQGEKFKNVLDYVVHGKGWLTTSGLDAQVFTHSGAKQKFGLDGDVSGRAPDLQLVCFNGEDRERGDEMFQKFFNYKDSHPGRTKNISDEDGALHSMCGLVMHVHPTSRGKLSLASDKWFDKPLIDPNYLDTEYDIEALVDGCVEMGRIMEAEVFKKLGCRRIYINGDEKNDDERAMHEKNVRNWTHTIYHPVGTCKMGNVEKDDMAVVDPQLRLRGAGNVRVCDASVMPHLTTGNTQAPCFLIGEKGADCILKDWEQRKGKRKGMISG